MFCIKCGNELQPIHDKMGHIIGYECVNNNCVEFGNSWTLAEHKDNQNWAVRHIHTLETELETSNKRIEVLENQISIFAQLLQSYCDMLQKHIIES